MHSAALEAASKAAVEALAKLDFSLTSVGLLIRPEVCRAPPTRLLPRVGEDQLGIHQVIAF
ncbi:MAG: hypothetical protein ACXVBG_19155, partial [Isosphaeraceae bacterium]